MNREAQGNLGPMEIQIYRRGQQQHKRPKASQTKRGSRSGVSLNSIDRVPSLFTAKGATKRFAL
jgi:hypothetical protein